jgi:hypothetical protein
MKTTGLFNMYPFFPYICHEKEVEIDEANKTISTSRATSNLMELPIEVLIAVKSLPLLLLLVIFNRNIQLGLHSIAPILYGMAVSVIAIANFYHSKEQAGAITIKAYIPFLIVFIVTIFLVEPLLRSTVLHSKMFSWFFVQFTILFWGAYDAYKLYKNKPRLLIATQKVGFFCLLKKS